MAVETHPTPDVLAAFGRGDLPAPELSAIAEHLAECEVCANALRQIPEGTLSSLARPAAQAPEAAPAVPAPAITVLAGLPDGLANHPRYKVLSELGSGGMGVVYKAEDQFMGRLVALKVMTPHLTAKLSAVDRFRKEVRAAAQLNHPNIVIAHDTGEAGGRHFLVMEFVEGMSLERLVAKKGPLAIPVAAHFARQAALGLQHASEKGMVHRDIKPQNLMVTRKGHLKIMDFGLARFATADAEDPAPNAPGGRLPFGARKPIVDGVTNPNFLLGTPDYLSPEQARNSHEVDTRSDVYSLGCTLYFLLAGRAPFASAESLIDKLLAHTREAPPPIRSLRPEVPDGLAKVLAKMMAKKRRERFATPGEAAAALAPFVKGGGDAPVVVAAGFEVIDAVVIAPAPQAARPEPSGAAFAFDTPAEPDDPTLVESERTRRPRRSRDANPWWRRKGALIAAAIVGFLCIGAIVAASANKKSDDPPDDASAKLSSASPQSKGKRKDNPWVHGGKSGSAPKVLFVLPSKGVWLADYLPVRERLEAAGITVETASSDGRSSKPMHNPKLPGEPVQIDHPLTSTFDTSPYAALVFCGAEANEYAFPNRGASAARSVIKQMVDSHKPVCSISLGQMALVANGVLRHKRAAGSESLFEKMPYLTKSARSEINWVKERVVASDKIITAATDADVIPFADAIMAALKSD